jgi:hypothetical protein
MRKAAPDKPLHARLAAMSSDVCVLQPIAFLGQPWL